MTSSSSSSAARARGLPPARATAPCGCVGGVPGDRGHLILWCGALPLHAAACRLRPGTSLCRLTCSPLPCPRIPRCRQVWRQLRSKRKKLAAWDQELTLGCPAMEEAPAVRHRRRQHAAPVIDQISWSCDDRRCGGRARDARTPPPTARGGCERLCAQISESVCCSLPCCAHPHLPRTSTSTHTHTTPTQASRVRERPLHPRV